MFGAKMVSRNVIFFFFIPPKELGPKVAEKRSQYKWEDSPTYVVRGPHICGKSGIHIVDHYVVKWHGYLQIEQSHLLKK